MMNIRFLGSSCIVLLLVAAAIAQESHDQVLHHWDYALTDFQMPDLEGQQVWRATLGLDLADRTVLEAEVLIWRIVRQKSSNPNWNQRESDFFN